MKGFGLKFFLIILCLASAGGCFVSSKKETNESTNSNATPANSVDNSKDASADSGAKAQDEIRKIDFKNFIYEPYCAGEGTQKITVKKGEYTLDKGDYDRLYFSVTNVSYGDVNGDQNEDAIILSVCNTGGTGQFSEGFVYGLKDGKPELLARIEGGDRADGGLRSAKVENGLLIVERNGAGETGGACCPEFVVTSKYKLEGKNLKQVGGDTKRDLYPPQRVRFEKGAREAFVDVKLTDEDDIKRFVIGAREMQMLSVESNSPNVSITLVKGEADIIEDGGKNFQATLKANGDFVIQVQKINVKTVNASINFDIR
ncbi:MAG TPA: hypothetical protein VGC97_13455 [Pyrinomonadaceae bacterium]|jgi:hypothetical protein